MQTYSCTWTVTGSAKFLTKLKSGSSRLKTVRTAENVERVANNEQLHNSMHASTVRAIFVLLLLVLHFVADPHTLVRLCINFTKLNFQFFSVNVEIIVWNITINDVQL